MQILFLMGLVLTIVMVVYLMRRQRDRDELTARVKERGGQVIRLERVRQGSPFPDTTRGWWAWRIQWQDGTGEHTAWALTTREGIQEWRDGVAASK